MASASYAGLLISVLIILLALQLSTANGYEVNIAVGRKMLQGLGEKAPHISGKNKPAEVDFSSKNFDARHERKENDESKAFLEAADEVANLMRKDYRGSGRPRRKPPINNHEPNH